MITGKQLADAAVAAIPMGITYAQEDCQMFVEQSVRRAGGEIKDYAGSNDMFRNACSVTYPLDGRKPDVGDVLFIVKPGYNAKYKDDMGDAEHIGIYTGSPEVVHSSATKGCVAESTLKNGWTHGGKLLAVFTGATEPAQPDQFGVIDLPSDQNVFFRIKPDKKSHWWARLKGGQIVGIVSESNGWTRVKAVGHDGYVESKFIKDLQGWLSPDTGTLPYEPTPSKPYDKDALKRELQGIMERAQEIIAILTE